jgi:hypothetical protein
MLLKMQGKTQSRDFSRSMAKENGHKDSREKLRERVVEVG